MGGICCCTTRRNRILCYATIDLVLYGLFFLLFTHQLLVSHSRNTETGYLFYFLLICLLCIVLACILGYSAKNKSYIGCKIWLIPSVVLLIVHIASWVDSYSKISTESDKFLVWMSSTVLVYKFYEISVVFSFMRKLKQPNDMTDGSNCSYAEEGV